MKTLSQRLAEHLNANADDIEVEIVDKTTNGAFLYRCFENGECRYVIEGETGELLARIESEDEAIDMWNN